MMLRLGLQGQLGIITGQVDVNQGPGIRGVIPFHDPLGQRHRFFQLTCSLQRTVTDRKSHQRHTLGYVLGQHLVRLEGRFLQPLPLRQVHGQVDKDQRIAGFHGQQSPAIGHRPIMFPLVGISVTLMKEPENFFIVLDVCQSLTFQVGRPHQFQTGRVQLEHLLKHDPGLLRPAQFHVNHAQVIVCIFKRRIRFDGLQQ